MNLNIVGPPTRRSKMFPIKSAINSLKKKDSFARNFAVTLSSNVLALIIGFAFTPIIARIYSPEAYGTFGLFLAISQNIGNLATLQFTRAFVLPEKDADFFDLVRITFISTLIFTFLSFIIFLIVGDWILDILNAQKLGLWLLVVPLSVFLMSMNDIWRSWNIRAKEFSRGASAKVVSTITTRLFTLVYGLLSGGSPTGLIAGDVLSKPFDSYFLRSKTIKANISVFFKDYNKTKLYSAIKQYKSYPLYVLPGNWLNNFSNQLPVYLLMGAFGAGTVGYYTQANSLLNLPGMVLSSSIAPLFLQKAAVTFRSDPKDMKRLVSSLYNRLFYLGVVPFCILAVFGDVIFGIFLGKQWRMAGEFTGYMGFYFLFWMISAPLNSLYRIYGKERLNFIVNISLILLKGIALYIGIFQGSSVYAILYFSIATLIGNLIHIWIGFALARLNFLSFLAKSLGLMAIIYTTCRLIKIILI